jgi:hypothetical protein
MRSTTDRTSTKIRILGALVALAWGVLAIDTFVYHHELLRFAIVARDPIGLRGILFAPFLYFNYQYLIIDTIAFALLGWSIMKQAIANFTIVSIICSVVGGLSIWLTGRASPVYYGGAGSLICGYASYLIALGYFDRRLRGDGLMALAIGCAYLVARSRLPMLAEYRWHTLGASWLEIICECLGGVLAAKLVFKK